MAGWALNLVKLASGGFFSSTGGGGLVGSSRLRSEWVSEGKKRKGVWEVLYCYHRTTRYLKHCGQWLYWTTENNIL